MDTKPPILMITYLSSAGNPHEFRVGINGVTEIRWTEMNGEYCMLPWIQVYADDNLLAEFNPQKLEHIFYIEAGYNGH